MIDPAQLIKKSLECLRLASACQELAGGVNNAQLREHFIRVARTWHHVADEGPTDEGLADENLNYPDVAGMTAANVLAA